MKIQIIIRRVNPTAVGESHTYYAELVGDSLLLRNRHVHMSMGKSEAEAVGFLMLAHPDIFGVLVTREG